MLNNNDLIKNRNKYTLAELKNSIHRLSKKILLNTQHLSEDFCVEYILYINDNTGNEDDYLFCEDYILECQSHLDEKLLLDLRNKKYKKYFNSNT